MNPNIWSGLSAQADDLFKHISDLENHYILCGGGRTGLHIIDRFCEMDIPFVVIEQNASAISEIHDYMNSLNKKLFYLQGDATEDDLLVQAGIAQAKGLITALSDDKDNLFVTLSARFLNPNIRIVARVNDENLNRTKLEQAGADRVISTDVIGGLRMASEMIRPEVVDFLDQMVRVTEKEKKLRFTELPLSEIKTPALRDLIDAETRGEGDLRITDIGQHTGLLVVAIKTRAEFEHNGKLNDDFYTAARKRYRFTPRGDEKLHSDDVLVVIGTQENLEEILKAPA